MMGQPFGEAPRADQHPDLDVSQLGGLGEVRRGDQRPFGVDHYALGVQARPPAGLGVERPGIVVLQRQVAPT